jgi:hypothetical protein
MRVIPAVLVQATDGGTLTAFPPMLLDMAPPEADFKSVERLER